MQSTNPFRRRLVHAAAAACALAACAGAQASSWPEKPVVLVVPYSAGGPTDVVARLLAIPMGQVLGQSVLVENTVGAGGTIAELLDYVRKNQDKVSLANAGIGAVSQLCGMLFMHQAGVKLTTVPYKGAGPAMNDLMGGQVDLLCDQTTQTVPVIKDGQRAKVFGVTTPKRLSSLPSIPTLDEQGLKGFDVKVWHGMYAPKGTPREVVMAINKALNVAIKDENVKKRIAELSSDLVTPDKATPEGLRTHLQAEVARWDKVIKAAGVSAE